MSNDIILGQADNDQELFQILDLQQRNLKSNISLTESEEQGFVSIKHNIEVLKKMNEPYGHIIATHDQQLVGYALVMLPSIRDEIPFLKSMFEIVDQLDFRGDRLANTNYFVMGQICIDKAYRGKGIFQKLYNYQREVLSEHFDYCITEISQLNTRSLKAHLRQGFQIVNTHPDDHGGLWEMVLWDWSDGQ